MCRKLYSLFPGLYSPSIGSFKAIVKLETGPYIMALYRNVNTVSVLYYHCELEIWQSMCIAKPIVVDQTLRVLQ